MFGFFIIIFLCFDSQTSTKVNKGIGMDVSSRDHPDELCGAGKGVCDLLDK